eukprot:TRINITY_DN61999_c1_g1_i1.p2 TRINITY_DN61999_c1_g1~~TRINITY_DN61999_c1_g1_i1.p2  ORF type:complete len:110 (-),score=5.39 TRINITY_DN61999_c1_g1_i1:106-435(-)
MSGFLFNPCVARNSLVWYHSWACACHTLLHHSDGEGTGVGGKLVVAPHRRLQKATEPPAGGQGKWSQLVVKVFVLCAAGACVPSARGVWRTLQKRSQYPPPSLFRPSAV